MPIAKAEFLSDNLFPESEAPTRVFIMLVESDAYLGTYSKSPFDFRRKWTVQTQQLNALHNSLQYENTYLKSSLDEMKGQLADLINALKQQNQPRSDDDDDEKEEDGDLESEDESLASKRAKKSKQSKSNLQKKPPKKVEKKLLRSREQKNNEKNKKQENVASGSSGIMGRIINSLNPFTEEIDLDEAMNDRNSITGQSIPGSILSAPQRSVTLDAATSVNYWVTNVELELMSSPLDQMTSKGTEEDAMVDYVRLQRCLNQFNQVISSGISYDQFLSSAFIAAFDLTTNQQPGLAYAINTVRTGEKFFHSIIKF